MEWNRLKTFYYVAKCQSFRKAADELCVAVSALSRSISLLEHQLKTTLFHRHPTGISLTQAGETLFETAQAVYSEIEKAENQILEGQAVPKGPLTISATQGMVNYYLTPFLPEFQKLYPEINLSIFARDVIPDFDHGYADIALCPPNPLRKDLEQKHLITNHVVLFASPEYLSKHGTPQDPQDLDHHQLIGIGDFPGFMEMNWHLSLGVADESNRNPYISISSPQSRLFLAEQGLGIAAVSREHPGLDKMNLVQVLPHITGPAIDIYIIYPKHLKNSKRIQAFENYMIPMFKKTYNPD
ncbi:LysR family transcriptional regulator [Candidatus Odyssella thessalonicensis]|uniref:LysR family transcriptional regulator n=1 Tax=Candidatus Odyssella thessalonicensis TaxID=84647 RepID=UPI000225BD8C|nr:LysR family transcriptional regulator [Candidatus Odyssella thessalonicensis]